MGLGHSPRIITENLVLLLDASNTKSVPKTNILTTWVDYGGNQTNYEVLGAYSVKLKNTTTGWVGYFPATVSSTGKYVITFTYYSDSDGSSLVLDNDGIMDNTYNTTLTVNITPQTYTGSVDVNTTGNIQHFFRRNGGGNIYVTNVSYFKLETTWTDLSTNGNTGTLVNGVGYSASNGGSLVFDGVDDYSSHPYSSLLDLGTQFTISSFIKFNNLSIISHIFTAPNIVSGVFTEGYMFYYNTGTIYGMNTNTLRLQFGQNNWAWNLYASNGISITDNTWHFVSVTASNLNTNNPTITFYIDGNSITGTFWNASSKAAIRYSSNINSPRVASTFFPSAPSYGGPYYLNGNIAQVSIYNRALTATEIAQNYNALKSRFIQDIQDGSSADRAAPSASHLSSIGIRADGDYWYLPPGQTTPIQLYTVFSSAPAGKGYVLVARGRESTDWWNTSGQNTSALTSTSINTNTPIAVLSNSFVNSLINSQWNGMRFITNRINGGDSWLFVGTTSTTFSWTYFQQSASTVNATATKYNSLFLSGGVALNWGSGVYWTDTLNYGGGNNCDRTFTWSWAGHGPYQGWSGGSSCTPAGSFQNGGEGHSIQLVNCYVEC